jgi:hypothetical protein
MSKCAATAAAEPPTPAPPLLLAAILPRSLLAGLNATLRYTPPGNDVKGFRAALIGGDKETV